MQKKSMEELQRKTVAAFKEATKSNIVVVLDDIRSMHNVGSVFRSCDAFLVEELILCGYTPQPPHRDIQKSALGATETVAWQHFTNTVDAINMLKEKGYKIIGIEQVHNAIMLNEFNKIENEKYALVFGNEVQGVNEEVLKMCDAIIEIPQTGSKHSLNISVSAGIVLWEFSR
jgi:tRNA G18 (ribose-2'-O)-methylase SpoU